MPEFSRGGGDEPFMSNPPMRDSQEDVTGEPEPKVDPVTAMTQKLDQLVNGNQRDSQRAQLMAELATDPEIRQILEARRTGKKINISVGDQVPMGSATPPEEEEEVVDWENMTNQQLAQKLPSIILKESNKLFEQRLSAEINPLRQELEMYKQMMGEVQGDKVRSSIEATKAKYPDFDAYRPLMVQLSNENPKLTPEDLYALAKIRSGKVNLLPPKPTASERPTSTSARPGVTQRTNAPARTGNRRQDFSNALSAALAEKEFTLDE